MSLDRIEASLAILEARQKAEGLPLRNEPPVIIFSTQPAMLVPIDGPPAYLPTAYADWERLGNTRALLLRYKRGKVAPPSPRANPAVLQKLDL